MLVRQGWVVRPIGPLSQCLAYFSNAESVLATFQHSKQPEPPKVAVLGRVAPFDRDRDVVETCQAWLFPARAPVRDVGVVGERPGTELGCGLVHCTCP